MLEMTLRPSLPSSEPSILPAGGIEPPGEEGDEHGRDERRIADLFPKRGRLREAVYEGAFFSMHDVSPGSRPCRTPSPFRTSLEELAALYAAIIGEAVPEFRRLDAAITDRLR